MKVDRLEEAFQLLKKMEGKKRDIDTLRKYGETITISTPTFVQVLLKTEYLIDLLEAETKSMSSKLLEYGIEFEKDKV